MKWWPTKASARTAGAGGEPDAEAEEGDDEADGGIDLALLDEPADGLGPLDGGEGVPPPADDDLAGLVEALMEAYIEPVPVDAHPEGPAPDRGHPEARGSADGPGEQVPEVDLPSVSTVPYYY